MDNGHSPHGECGLKFRRRSPLYAQHGSLPAWGVRVEIAWAGTCRCGTTSLPAWGVRVEMFSGRIRGQAPQGHSPHGECGLKFVMGRFSSSSTMSLPAWGVRVEIRCSPPERTPSRCHSPHGECGLKCACRRSGVHADESLPAWGVRVEIPRCSPGRSPCRCHSPHGECGLKFVLGVYLKPVLSVTPRMGSAG